MRNKIILPLFLLSLSLGSCKKILFEKDQASKNPQENFDYLWNEANRKYAYFDLKGIDWNQIKTTYQAKLYTGMSDDSLFNVLGAMLNELKDDHTNLISGFNISGYGVRFLGPDNFDWRVIEDHYLNKKFQTSGPFQHDFLDSGRVGYVRFGAFTGTVSDYNMDYIINRYQNTKGLILDLRENGGGAATDIFNILNRFVDEKTLLYYSRIKTGEGKNDFSDPEPVYVTPYNGTRYTGKKVMVLTDRGTYSAGSFTSLATKALPNMIMVGDTTGGGLGMPNGGQLPNGWTYRFSVTQAMNLDKDPSWEQGVPPDIFVRFNWNDMTRDEVLDRALAELK